MSGTILNGVVENTETIKRTTRFGEKDTYYFYVGGEKYSTGFSRHNLNRGDVVSFSFSTDRYGNQVDVKAISKAAEGMAPKGPAAAPAAKPAERPAYSGGSKGVFPIPPLDGQRSIVRQNALTNAREVYTHYISMGKTSAIGTDELERAAMGIVAIAKLFERYTAGDMDLEEVEAESTAKAA